jgi:methylmalonyl-CoA mutase
VSATRTSWPRRPVATRASPPRRRILPPDRSRYLGEIADTVRGYRARVEAQAKDARRRWRLEGAADEMDDGATKAALLAKRDTITLTPEVASYVRCWPELRQSYLGDTYSYEVRGKTLQQPMKVESLSHLQIPRVSAPRFEDAGEIVRVVIRGARILTPPRGPGVSRWRAGVSGLGLPGPTCMR